MTPHIVTVEVEYDIKNDKFTILDTTTAKKEALSEIIENYIRSQIGSGENASKPIEREVYHIKVALNLDVDSFRVTHDCGNDGLCLGILLNLLQTL